MKIFKGKFVNFFDAANQKIKGAVMKCTINVIFV